MNAIPDPIEDPYWAYTASEADRLRALHALQRQVERWRAFSDAEVEVIAMGMTMHEYQASDAQLAVFDALAEEALAECTRRGIPDPTRDVDAP